VRRQHAPFGAGSRQIYSKAAEASCRTGQAPAPDGTPRVSQLSQTRGLDMDRISFTILIETAVDTVTTASAVVPHGYADLLGTIGTAALADLLPAWRRHLVKARSRKNPTSKYSPNAGQHPATTQTYRFHTDIAVFEEGLASRSRR
jgi:hypothetical protein